MITSKREYEWGKNKIVVSRFQKGSTQSPGLEEFGLVVAYLGFIVLV